MKLKKYLIIFCLFMVLLGCIGATSAATDDTMNEKVTEIESGDYSISVINNDNQLLGVDNESALSAQSVNDDEISIHVSLEEYDSTILSDSGGDEFYVSTGGNDENTGTQESPFATIAKAISLADDSKDTIVYIGEGTFEGQGNTNLAINIDHLNSGGSLTLAGIDGKTIIDGENQNPFISSINRNAIIIIENIYFNNTKGQNGGAISGQGTLTVDNCVFENTYATSNGGAININQQSSADLKVTNSTFKNIHSNGHGGAIYSYVRNAEIINNTFINCTGGNYAQGAAIYSNTNTNSRINGNKFYNITTTGSSYDAGLYTTSWGNSEIINNTFVNCLNSGTQYAVIYIGADYVSGNKFINSSSTSKGLIYTTKSFNCVINVNDAETKNTMFTLSANVADVDGNSITCNSISYLIDGENLGNSQVVNGTSTLNVVKFYENGQYEISCRFSSGNVMPTINNGTLTANIDKTPMDLWVDAENGEDVETAGNETNPFKSISYAISQSPIETTIHLKEGTYKGEGNTNLEINMDHLNSGGSLTLMGVGDKTIIDGENQNRFISSINKNSFVILQNIYINNTQANDGAGGAVYCQNGNVLTVDNCTFENSFASYQGGAIFIQSNSAYLTVTDSVFKNDHSISSHGGAICAQNGVNSVELVNNTFINCTQGSSANGAAINSMAYNFRISENKFYNITVSGSSYDAALYTQKYSIEGNYEITDNTFMNCHNLGTQYAVIYISADYVSGNKFINCSSASKGLIYAASPFNFIINVSDVETTSTSFTLTSNITDVDGNTISIERYSRLQYYIDGEQVGAATVINGTAPLDATKAFDNGEHTISCALQGMSSTVMPTINNGTLTVNIDITPVELWVDVENGEDVETAGNETNPFKSISYAISQSSFNATLHLKEGAYKGENNTNITISTIFLTIIGEGKDKTIIDGENSNYFFDIANGNTIFSNLTFVNGFVAKDDNRWEDYCIRVSSTSSLVLDSVKYENNTEMDTENMHNYYGILDNGLLTIINCEFNNNGNDKGLCIISSNMANPIIIYNSTFANNTGTRYIIQNQNGLTNVTSSHFIDNKATCIYGQLGSNDEVYVVDSNFTNNHALNQNGLNGGAIYGRGYVSDCIFTNNSAYSYGGAIYFDKGEILNCDFYDNSAPTISANGGGGAIYIRSNGQATIENCYFKGNKALTAAGPKCSGGAIFNEGIALIISCNFTDNSAVQRGGAIRNGFGYGANNLTVIDSIFINNTAGSGGGAISAYLDPSSWTVSGYNYIYSSIFINNTASVDGGAIENYRPLLDIDDCSFEGNTALSGGAIKIDGKTNGAYFYYSKTAVISNTNFTKNHAESSGGAIESLFIDTELEISKSIFEGNDAPIGGAINCANITLSYSALVNNTDLQGTAIFMTAPADLENNWWGCNDDPNQFIDGSEYEITSWAIVNTLPKITDITPGDNITVYFTDNHGNELEDTIPMRQIIAGDESYELAGNTAIITAEKTGAMTLSVDNEAFVYQVRIPTTIEVENDTLTLNVNDQVATGASLTPADAGNLTYTSSNEEVARVENGKIIALSEGTAVITVSFAGNDDYAAAENKTISVSVTKISTTLTSDDVVVAYKDPNAELTATITDVSGNPLSVDLEVDLNGESYNVTSDSDGKISIPIGVLAPKTYVATISYAGDDTYAASSTTANVVVSKADTSISAMDDGEELVATLTNEYGQALVSANVVVNINGVDYTLKTNSKGQAKLSKSDLEIGTYTATVSYAGNNKYNPSNASIVITVKSETNLAAPDVNVIYLDESGELVATLTNAQGKALTSANVVVNLNGVDYALKTNSKGQVKVSTSDLTPKTYVATISYAGNSKYKPTSVTANVVVSKAATSISAIDDGENLVATLTNEYGKALSSANVVVNLNGVDYALKTNSKGQVKISIADLDPKDYAATFSYAGNSKYNSAAVTINAAEGKTTTNISTVYSKETNELITTLTNTATGNGIKGAKVVVKINGVKNSLTTDSNGQVKISTEELDPNTYTIISSYAGNSKYTATSTTQTIFIKN